MSYRLLSSGATVQVWSPTLVTDAVLCTILSSPSGSVLIRTVPQQSFDTDKGAALLNSFSDAVENVLQAGIAVDAAGTQRPDSNGLLLDAVLFTVQYVPTYPAPGPITGQVEILVDLLDADLGLLQGAGVDTPAELLLAEYNKLKALAGE
jgi:hypothetical protein